MRPTRLAIESFQSYREPTVIDLSDVSAAVVTGANGSGKTSIVDAVAWALFGRTRGSGADSIVSYSAARCRVVLDFEIGHQLYRVERQRDRMKGGSSSLELTEWNEWSETETGSEHANDASCQAGECANCPIPVPIEVPMQAWRPVGSDRISETQVVIEDLLGMNFQTWSSTSFIGQGRADAFTSMRPAERKDLLAEVLELGVYEGLADRARLEERNERGLAEASRQEAERAGEQVAALAASGDELARLRERAEQADVLLSQAEGDAVATRANMEHLQEKLRAIAARPVLERQLEELRGRVAAHVVNAPSGEEVENARGNLALKEADLAAAETALDGFRDLAIEREQAVATMQAQLVAARGRREDLAGAEAVCPLCRHPITDEERGRLFSDANRACDELFNRHGAAEEQARRARLKVAEFSRDEVDTMRAANRARRDALAAMEHRFTTAQDFEAQRQEAAANARDVERQIAELPAGFATDLERQLHVERERLGDLDRNIRELQTSQQHLSREIGLAEAKVAQHGALVEQAAAAALKASSHEEVRHLAELAARACGRDGIPARLIEAAIPEIEDRANEVLAHLMGELTVTLESTRATKTAGIRETLDIVVIAAGEERPLEELSGSERASVDIALRLGLSMMLAARAGSPMDLLVIDEGFTAFDTEHRQAVPGILRRLADIFPMVLLVTHEQLFADAFDTRILVARGENGSSTVRIEGTRAAA